MSPIGVFDSGLGGMSVLSTLAKSFPNDDFIYLGDTARLPYGTKSPDTIRKYTEQNLQFLSQFQPKAMIIACNTASTQFRETHFQEIPVFGVINPGARAAVRESETQKIGVLGTRATIASRAYEIALKTFAPQAEITSVAAPLLVPLAEEAWIDDPLTNMVVYRYVQALLQAQVDTLILGCTHYPLLRNSIQKAMGQNVKLIESGQVLAEDLAAYKKQSSHSRKIHFYATDLSEHMMNFAQKIMPEEMIEFSLAEITGTKS